MYQDRTMIRTKVLSEPAIKFARKACYLPKDDTPNTCQSFCSSVLVAMNVKQQFHELFCYHFRRL